MRNYLKMLALYYHGHQRSNPNNTNDLVAWGGDIDECLTRMAPQVAYVSEGVPDMIFDRFEPQKVYFEINQTNFGILLNGPLTGVEPGGGFLSGTYAINVYGNVPLPPIPNISAVGTAFYRFTTVASPRRTWSHGH